MPTPTLKQELFVREYVKNNGNGAQAALKVYNTTDPNTARAIASENLTKPNVKQELDKILSQGKLELKNITSKLSEVIHETPAKGYSGADIMEAIKTGLKLHGVLTDRKQISTFNVNTGLETLSKYELLERHKKITQETQAIIDGEEE